MLRRCAVLLATRLLPISASVAGTVSPPNILLFTADDAGWSSLGSFGGRVVPTPALDGLAAQGMRFEHAHITTSVCTPSRAVMLTGRHPLRNGGYGFNAIHDAVPTLPELLHTAGYFTGIFGKATVITAGPYFKGSWDTGCDIFGAASRAAATSFGAVTRHVFDSARRQGKPFFLMLNSTDPHRPLATPELDPATIPVPAFLPDLPEIRRELAQYYASIRRLDASVGECLRALDELGAAKDTLVVFLSDNGMPFPFAKATCYLHGTRTPLIVRWPGRIKAGSVDRMHLLGMVDLAPTLLAAAGLPPPEDADGRSFLPVLRGEEQAGRDVVFTEYNPSHSHKHFVRAAQDRRFLYIFNPWVGGDVTYTRADVFQREVWVALQKATAADPAIAQRFAFYERRVVEEFYDTQADPDCLHNLIAEPTHAASIERLTEELRAQLRRLGDPVLPLLDLRRDPVALRRAYAPILEKYYISTPAEFRLAEDAVRRDVAAFTDLGGGRYRVKLVHPQPVRAEFWAGGLRPAGGLAHEARREFDVDLAPLPPGRHEIVLHFAAQTIGFPITLAAIPPGIPNQRLPETSRPHEE